MEGDRQQRRSRSRHRRSLRDDVEIEAGEKAVAQNRPRQGRDPRRPRGLLGPGCAGRLCVQGLARRQAMDPSLSHPPRRGRTGRFRLPSGRGAIRALDLRRPAGRARKGDRRDQPLRPRRRGVGEGGGAGCGARPRPGEAPQRREHHGRLRLCALSARGVHRMGRRLRNRLLGLPLRRRQELSRGRPHPHRQWRQRQLLVALDHEPLFSPDRP